MSIKTTDRKYLSKKICVWLTLGKIETYLDEGSLIFQARFGLRDKDEEISATFFKIRCAVGVAALSFSIQSQCSGLKR